MNSLQAINFVEEMARMPDNLVAKTMSNACKPMHHWKAILVSFLLTFWVRGNSLQKYAFILHL